MEAIHTDFGRDTTIPPITTRPLSAALGLEVLNVDLREPPTLAQITQLRDAWHAGLILLLRDQTLAEEDQVRFAECFGTLAKTINVHNTGSHPAVMLISNIRKDGKPIGALPDGEMHFHTDQCYVEKPAAATMLYAIEVPSVGGNTLFANRLPRLRDASRGDQASDRRPQSDQCLRLRQRLDHPRHAASRGCPAIFAPRGPHSPSDRTQGALRQPPDDHCHRRPTRGRK